MGAWLEFVYNGLIGAKREFTFEEYAKAIREVGAAHCILSSDLGQAANPVHPGGLAAFFAGLERAGVSRTDIELMSRTNPARALGL
jgi:predicted metal-dependent TIM-barrel fold hydrolase